VKILVVRNDKLGDFVLSLPCFSLLKQTLPNTHLTALVPEYTKPIADKFPDIDEVITDDNSIFSLTKKIKKQNFDAVIVLFSTTRIAIVTLLAGINKRIAPKTKIAQFLYHKPLLQKRSLSLKPEYQYNLELVEYFLGSDNIQLTPPFWQLEKTIKVADNTIIIHPGCGGSANNLNIEQYAKIANKLSAEKPELFFAITAGREEEKYALDLLEKIKTNNKKLVKNLNLMELVEYINSCDIFIGGSTGPLHIAGILNKKTVAFYPNLRSSTALRWQTLNQENKRLSFSPIKSEQDMSLVDINLVVKETIKKFL